VAKIVKLFNILADRIDWNESYTACIITLIRVFQYPFFKEKTSDELVYEQLIAECISNMGYLLRIPSVQVREEICACIYNLITFECVPDSYANLQRCSRAFILKCVRLSDLPETMVKVSNFFITIPRSWENEKIDFG
jgi:hypothetical protein